MCKYLLSNIYIRSYSPVLGLVYAGTDSFPAAEMPNCEWSMTYREVSNWYLPPPQDSSRYESEIIRGRETTRQRVIRQIEHIARGIVTRHIENGDIEIDTLMAELML